MQMLAGAFAGVADGTPGMLLLGGEAGVGKSRLVAEFAAQVRGRALPLKAGRWCWPGDASTWAGRACRMRRS